MTGPVSKTGMMMALDTIKQQLVVVVETTAAISHVVAAVAAHREVDGAAWATSTFKPRSPFHNTKQQEEATPPPRIEEVTRSVAVAAVVIMVVGVEGMAAKAIATTMMTGMMCDLTQGSHSTPSLMTTFTSQENSMKSITGRDNIQASNNSSKHMEVGAVEINVKGISVAAVTKANSEEATIMATMTAMEEGTTISTTEEVADRMVVGADLEAATTGEAE